MSASDTEDSAFVGDYCAAKLGNVKGVAQTNLLRNHLFNIKEMNGFAAPLEVMHELMGWVTLFQNKSIVKQLIKFVDNINFLVVSDFTSEFSELSNFKD